MIHGGADVNKRDKNGVPVHFLLCRFDADAAIFQLLIECGIDINAQDTTLGFTFFHNFFNIYRHSKILAICMELNINCNIISNNGKTPIQLFQNLTYQQEQRKSLVKLMAKMEKDKKMRISDDNMLIINYFLPHFYNKCQHELEAMKKHHVALNITFNDLLSKSLNELASYIRNTNLLNYLDSGVSKKFEIYGDLVEIRMRMALARKKILDKCVDVLTLLFNPKYGPKLPRLFFIDVVTSLNSGDLQNLSVTLKI